MWRLVIPCALLLSGYLIYAQVSSATADAPSATEARLLLSKLAPLHKPLGKTQPGDWLERHKEPGQTFDQYLRSSPVTLHGERKTIYVQPLGDFKPDEKRVMDLTVDYMGRFFSTDIKVLDPIPLSMIPEKAKRVRLSQQILSTYVLDILKPRLPKDSAAIIALTATDLWPGEGWNFVFGQASIRERVGVWSMHRNGDPSENEEAFKLCLKRTIKTAVHETGHMLSIRHCIAYQCCMCGSNSRRESDRQPIYLCPEDVAKICWATQTSASDRYERLLEFCEANGLDEEAEFFQKSIDLLKK